MSMFHRVKCAGADLADFKTKVRAFLDKSEMPYYKIIALRSYDGEVRVYKQGKTERRRRRQGRKIVAFKNHEGVIEGENQDAIERLKKTGADKLYCTTNKPIETLNYTQVFRVDNWEEEKEALRDFFKEDV